VWNSVFSKNFDKGIKRHLELKKNIKNCLLQLLNHEKPHILTIYKKNLELNVYEINSQYRIGMKINSITHTILFLRCCTHKEVYGKD